MKNKRTGRLVAFMLTLAMSISILCFAPLNVNAASERVLFLGHVMPIKPDIIEMTDEEYLWAGDPTVFYYSESLEDNSLKSSNPKVIKVVKRDEYHTDIMPLKAGKATLTAKIVDFLDDEDKEQTVKRTIKVKKYPNQIKSLSVNGKKVKLSGNKRYEYVVNNFNKTTASVKLELKKGWKIKAIRAMASDTNKEKDLDLKKVVKKNYKSGKSFKVPKRYDNTRIWFIMKNSKGEEITYVVRLLRK